MPRKPQTDRRPATTCPDPADAKRSPTLASLRGDIDRVDKELVTLLNRRAEFALQIGQVKQKQGIEVWSPAREDEVIAKALASRK
ncbi:MAG: chorismate mutase [Planctomycetia bacterium]|nr:chorismate mutase [Planctomycetia bacterium]